MAPFQMHGILVPTGRVGGAIQRQMDTGVELRTEEVTLLILPRRGPGQKAQSDLLWFSCLGNWSPSVHAPTPFLGCFLHLDVLPVEMRPFPH